MLRYLDRKLNSITSAEVQKLREDPEYTIVRRFLNDRFRVIASWHGICDLKETIPITYARPFKLSVEVLVKTGAEGRQHPDGAVRFVEDIDASESVRTEDRLIALYEDFLVRYCGCKFVPSTTTASGFQLIEIGNQYAPLDKNVPIAAEIANPSNYGSW